MGMFHGLSAKHFLPLGKESLPQVRPEFMHQIEACIADEIEADAAPDGSHTLAQPRHIQIAQCLRYRTADNARRIEGAMTVICMSNHHPAHRIQSALREGQTGIAEIPGILFEHRGNQELLKEDI